MGVRGAAPWCVCVCAWVYMMRVHRSAWGTQRTALKVPIEYLRNTSAISYLL